MVTTTPRIQAGKGSGGAGTGAVVVPLLFFSIKSCVFFSKSRIFWGDMRLANWTKLFSKEDFYSVHKTLGFLVLLHYFVILSPLYERWKLLPLWTQAIGVLLHVCLGFSSFIFRIPISRSSSYTIYRELQLHNNVFMLRSVILWFLLVTDYDSMTGRILLFFATHTGADFVTANFAPHKGGSLIRRETETSEEAREKETWLVKIPRRSFSISQLGAIHACLFDTCPRTQVAILLSIQLGAFAATLVRKAIVTWKEGAFLYGLALIVSWVIKMQSAHWIDYVFIATAVVLRFYVRVNKYILWSAIFVTQTAIVTHFY